MEKQQLILLVEDDPEVMATNTEYFKSKGYDVLEADTIARAQQCLRENTPDIIILDVYLPDGLGFEFCQDIREQSSIPVIFLTIEGKHENIVDGLSLGGDDYIVKPYDLDELNARVEALLRRYKMNSEYKIIKIHPDFFINAISLRAFFNNIDICLSTKEVQILAQLAREGGKFIPEEQLFKEVWGIENDTNLKTMMVHVSTLRTKLRENDVTDIVVERDEEKGFRLIVT